MMDAVNIRLLSSEAYQALTMICESRNWTEIRPYMQPEDVALLTFRLRFVDDTETNFPKGKWSMIQRLQDLLCESAKKEKENRE